MNLKRYAIVILTAVGLSVFVYFLLFKLHLFHIDLASFKGKQARNGAENVLTSFAASILKFSTHLQYRTEGLKFSSDIPVQNSRLKTLTLQEVIGKTPKIFFRDSELKRSVCVDGQIKLIKPLVKELGRENIILLSTYRNHRSGIIFKRINNLDVEIYNLGDQNLGLPPEHSNAPFVFITDSTLTARLVFVPAKEIPALSEEYYKVLRIRFKEMNAASITAAL